MNHNVFLLVKDPNDSCRDIIRSRDTDLKIMVYCLDEIQFQAHPDEIQLYANDRGNPLVFETINIKSEDALDMASAIQWYAKYIGNPEMEILPEDPRSEYNLD
ncbi:MAG: hypothetical protein ACRYFA_14185 [Janthinobacterium lividum]